MLLEESARRQTQLIEYLWQMSESLKIETELREIAFKMKTLYTDGFRHDYSGFFPLIVEISKDKKYTLDFLSNNLVEIRKLVQQDYVNGEKDFRGLYWPLSKLSDHINLEIARYAYYSVNEQKVEDLEKRNEDLQQKLKNASNDLEEAQKKISTSSTDLIAVLSIFAAIVLTFSGSLSFLGNALSSMQNVSIFKSAFVILICGIVLFNSIYLMMYLVGKITQRNIYAKCKSEDCTCNNGMPKCNGLARIRKRLPYFFWFNVLLILLIVAIVVLWWINLYYHILPFT